MSAAPLSAAAPSPAIVQVNTDARGSDTTGDAANEPTLAVDTLDPRRLVLGWRQFDDASASDRSVAWAVSWDGGRSWQPGGTLAGMGLRTDPVLVARPGGGILFASITPESGAFRCDVFASTDGGRTWSAPGDAWGGDKPWIAVDPDPGRPHVYVTWSRSSSCCAARNFSRSTDGGATFEDPVPVPGTPQWGTIAVAPDGRVFVAGVSLSDPATILVARSSNARDPAATPSFDLLRGLDLGGAVRASLGPASPNPDGFLGQVWIACDASTGPTSGNLYLLCSVDPPGPDPMDVRFARSTDGGETWSAPLCVHRDATSAWQWFGALAVAPNGRLDAIWNDTRYTGSARHSQLFYAASFDAGASWMLDLPVSPVWDSHVGWPAQNKIGDYMQVVSDALGTSVAFAATWNGGQDIFFLRLGEADCNANGRGDSFDIAAGTSTDWNWNGVPDECEAISPSDVAARDPASAPLSGWPNPSAARTTIAFVARAVGAVRLEILDVGGRRVRSFDLTASPGRQEIVWDGTGPDGMRLGAGIYWCRLRAPWGEAATRLVRTAPGGP